MNRKNIVISVLIVVATVAGSAFMNWASLTGDTKALYFSPDASLKELAQKNGIQPRLLKFKLEHDGVDVGHGAMQQPISNLGLDESEIRGVLLHAMETGSPRLAVLKFTLWAVLSAAVVLIILKRKKTAKVRKVVMIATVVVFGVLLGATPNPMESIVKAFKLVRGIQAGPLAVLVSLAIFSLFSIWGAKLICSWGCHLGALQETLFNIPILKKKYRFQVSFVLSLVVRLIIFAAFVVLLFRAGDRAKDIVLYHHVNYFKLFPFDHLAKVALYTLPIMIVASVFVFRPFCQFVCPFGLWAWLLQNVTINKVRIDRAKCIECKKCVKNCPTQAMKGTYAAKRNFFLPDCWSCGKCIEVCPTNAVNYGTDKPAAVPTEESSWGSENN